MLGLAALWAPSVSASANSNQINPDPAVHFGVLPNGLRYAVMRNGAPKGAVSIRFGVEVGRFEENDGERGIAHFLEHLAYGDTKSFPEKDLLKTFAAMGVAFGRDQNAETTLNSTTYELDLPSGDPASLDLGFRWLREVADAVEFRPEKVEEERRIVLAELSVRDTPMSASTEAEEGFLERGLRSAERSPGSAPDLSAIGPAQLKAFHEKWYRPDNAIVVVVGDLPVEALEQRVRDSFSSWAAQGPSPARPPYGRPDEARGEDVFIRSDAALPGVVGACRVHAADWAGARDVERLRRRAAREIWLVTLNDRLARAANVADPPFVHAHAYVQEGREAETVCLTVLPTNGDWQRGLKSADLELKRLAAGGITDDELDHALEAERSHYRGALFQAGTRTSDQLASDLMDSELDHDVFASPAEKFRGFDDAVENLTAAEVLAAFKADWSGAGPFLVAHGPTPPEAQALRLAWDADEAASLATTAAGASDGARPPAAARAPAKAVAWGYSDFGRPGRVVERRAFTAPEFVRLTFSNGVVVNFKSTKFAADSVLVRVRFGHGRRGLAPADIPTALLAAGLFQAGGVGRHDFQEIRSLFHENAWGAGMSLGDDAFVLRGDTTRNGLEDQLEILTAYVSDPGFSPTLDARIPTAVQATYHYAYSHPSLAAGDALARAFAPALAVPPVEQLARLRTADFERVLKPALTQAPLEITIVGDVDEATVSRLVARTFGVLPVRKAAPASAGGGGWLRFPEIPPKELQAVHEGAPDKAAVLVVWPLYVATPERRREELALEMVADLLSIRLKQRVREELGDSYDPSAATAMPDHADQGYLAASVETSTAAAARVVAEVRAAAEELAKGDISPEALEVVRKPLLAQWAQRVQSNSWWAADLEGSARGDHPADDPSFEAGIYGSLTLAEIRKAAADWLSREPIVVTAEAAATERTAAR